jgi:PAS domain S-box-containing protein
MTWFRDQTEGDLTIGEGNTWTGNSSLAESALSSGETIWIADLDTVSKVKRDIAPPNPGLHCGCAVPVRVLGKITGILEFYSPENQKLDAYMVQVLSGLAAQLSLFIEQEHAEKALRQSEERLALVIQGSNDGIWDWDITSGQAYFSPRWKSMLGYEDHEIANTFAAWVNLQHPEDRPKVEAAIRTYFAGETSKYELEHRLRHKDGSYRWVLARGVVLRDNCGKPVRMAGSHVDLTDRKLAAERLEQACAKLAARETVLKRIVRDLHVSHRELKKAQMHLIQAAKLESVGTLAAGVAHEVKNPLQTILMGVDYLCRRIPAEARESQEALEDMRDAVQRANSIIGELLVFSRETDFQTRPESLNAVIDRSLHLLTTDFVAAHTEIVRHLDGNLPLARMDPTKIQQVFINLFQNAIQAMPRGGTLTLTTRSRRVESAAKPAEGLFRRFNPGDLLVVAEVADTGHGIPEVHLERVFDLFFTTKPTGVGNGLGLSIAKKIVDLHGGEIQIRNLPTGGVSVTVALKV